MAIAETEIGAHLDQLRVSKFHRNVLLLIAGGLLLDSFDIYLAGGVLAALVKLHWVAANDVQYFLSATFVGLFLGAATAGYLGDRLGRRTMYQTNLLIFGLASIAAAFSPNYQVLIVLRAIMGFGLGAELVLGYATFAEFIPAQVRGTWNSWLGVVANGASLVAAVASFLVIPNLGWQAMFILVGVPSLIVWWFRRALPESPRWLVTRGRMDEALDVVARIDQETGVKPLERQEVRPVASNPGRFIDLFSSRLWARSILAMVLYSVSIVGIYGFTTWLPTVLVSQGVSVVKSLGVTLLITAGSAVGGLVTSAFGDRVNSKWFLVVSSVLTAIAGVAYAYTRNPVAVVVVGFVFVTIMYAFTVMEAAVYIPALFPNNVRMRGVALAQATARLVGVVLPFGVAAVLTAYSFGGVVIAIGIVFLLTAVLVAVLGVDTTKRSLEELGQVTGAPGAQGSPARGEVHGA